MNLNMSHEAIRLPAWVASLLAVAVLPFAVDVLTGLNWQEAMAAALAAVIPLLAGTETLRAFTDSPATRAERTAETEAYLRHRGEAGESQVFTILLVVLIIVVILLVAGVL